MAKSIHGRFSEAKRRVRESRRLRQQELFNRKNPAKKVSTDKPRR